MGFPGLSPRSAIQAKFGAKKGNNGAELFIELQTIYLTFDLTPDTIFNHALISEPILKVILEKRGIRLVL
ncbi:hypothetical protein GCM10007063_12830 [Lentibacillus kapialis]|uniref:Uncharacterized protein n=1 Tax=Lentibacillus kapialis TaxID=340214 RepID=A0A917PTC4_9BACI|nr:hypothetical protein GCM10007063_12830 [Lentibacillus kapialis]